MTDVQEDWMENINVWILEQGRVVTYKWLAKSLNVHVNVAKRMLFAFADKNQDKTEVLYLVAGKSSLDDQNIVVSVVRAKNLKLSESKFTTLTSKHVYAVTPLQTDAAKECLKVELEQGRDAPLPALTGIKNKRATPRASNEPPPDVAKDVKEVIDTKPPKVATKNVAEVKPKKKSTANAGGGIAGMFAKAAVKKESASAAAKKDDLLASQSCPQKENKMNKEKEQKEQKASKKRNKSSHKDESQSKRRKRIQVMSDSDSDEEEEAIEQEEEQVVVDSPPPPQAVLIESDDEQEKTPEPQKSPSPAKMGQGETCRKRRRKVLKQVSKTYVDENGFMVTKKEMMSGSETDDDEVETKSKSSQPDSVVQQPDKKKKPLANANANNKQSSIMSFFKRN